MEKILIIIVGLLLAGAFPFHRWVVKVGNPLVYSVINTAGLLLIFFGARTEPALLIFGYLSMLLGVFVALAESDEEKIIAYNNLAQTGLVLMALGLNTALGLLAAMLMIVNQALVKPLLLVASEKRNSLERLIAWLANAVLPPFAGFWALHYLILSGIQKANLWLLVIVIGGSIGLLAISLRAIKRPAAEIKLSWTLLWGLAVLLFGFCMPLVIEHLANPLLLWLVKGGVK
jgi:formate hydrogenlyase subunit 3/multisubunit Na+/H+ antiporter MnhD subunit